VHQRTVAHKESVRAWVTDLAGEAGAKDPAGLARTLTLLLDGGLADGAVVADPRVAESARESARILVAAAVA
jgi:hypothetical protein